MHLFTDTELHLMTRMEEHTTLYCGAHSKSGAKRDCNLDSLGNPPEETRCPTVSRLLAYYDRTAQSYYTTITAGFFNNCPASTAPGIFSILLLASPNAQLAFELEVLPPIYDSTDWTVIASGPPGVKSIITHDRLSSVQPAVTVSLKIDFNERQQHYADWIECCQAWLTFSAEIDVLEQKMTIIPDSQKLEVYCATTSERDPMSGSSSKCSPAALGHPKGEPKLRR
ncbi:uncharacterized protein L969DRAFT_87992 [Mixia osmundae IAM 14324]|uniref:uncharacterized protein n=1 Tax=Mixia osmundae (strain CBS 9802 / IAM 14324 / JCM 22182 / KY 12970) TaxID=764103 RepID=UPI0004A55392|nr:uncharacterized protein L969DRAFT_87992 [Mixia osmundae IAM 14324]KEI38726.1 hypothetical protein L969DRAFT_87992 [Mixia osmundae IAM 14324]